MTITGTLKVKKETQVVNDRFAKRDFVLTDNSNPDYPQHISLQLTQDKCKLIDGAKIGDTFTAHINIRGREWTSPQGEVKYFNTLECWKLVRVGEVAEVHSQSPMSMSNDFDSSEPKTEGKDDLPF